MNWLIGSFIAMVFLVPGILVVILLSKSTNTATSNGSVDGASVGRINHSATIAVFLSHNWFGQLFLFIAIVLVGCWWYDHEMVAGWFRNYPELFQTLALWVVVAILYRFTRTQAILQRRISVMWIVYFCAFIFFAVLAVIRTLEILGVVL